MSAGKEIQVPSRVEVYSGQDEGDEDDDEMSLV